MNTKSIKTKIIVLSCLLTIVGLTILAHINITITRNEVSQTLLEESIMEVKQIAGQAELIMSNGGEVEKLQELVDRQVATNDYIAYAVVINTNVQAIAHSDHEKIGISYTDDAYTVEGATQGKVKNMEFYADVQQKWVYDIMVPINVEGEQVGAIDIGIYQNQILTLVNKLIRIQLIGIIILELVFVCLLYVLCQVLFKSLERVVKYLDDMAKGDFTISIEEAIIKRKDEIGFMGNELNNMRLNLSQLISTIANEANKLKVISDSLMGSAEETKFAANDITESIAGIVEGNKEQTKLSDQTITMSEEINVGMERITENIQSVAISSSNSVASAEKGNKLVQAVSQQMQKINMQVTDSSNQIQMLGQKSKEIENITVMITQIANQTNLLALNASIEAARAGEHGKGFAVVADEVRVLAEQSTQAAENISNIVKAIQGEINQSISTMDTGIATVKDGLELVNETGEAFETILKEISEVSGEMESVSAVTEEVNAGTQNVLYNIEEVGKISQSNAKATEEVLDSAQNQEKLMQNVTTSSEMLMELSKSLNEHINVFKI